MFTDVIVKIEDINRFKLTDDWSLDGEFGKVCCRCLDAKAIECGYSWGENGAAQTLARHWALLILVVT